MIMRGDNPVQKEEVLKLISVALMKCSSSLGIKMSEEAILTLSEDLLDVYLYESIEDVIYCLKKGRQGVYGFGHNSRSSLNMIVIREWMTNVLDEKAQARERVIESRKEKESSVYEVDYEAFKKQQIQKKNVKSIDEETKEFNNYKAKYLAKKNKK